MVIARIMYTVMKALIWLALYFPVARSVKTWRAVSLDRDRCSINSLRICFIINNCLYSPHPARQLAGTPLRDGEGPGGEVSTSPHSKLYIRSSPLLRRGAGGEANSSLSPGEGPGVRPNLSTSSQLSW